VQLQKYAYRSCDLLTYAIALEYKKEKNMSYVDIALLAIFALFALLGFIWGFAKSAGKLFGWILSLLIVLIITDLVVNALLGSEQIAQFVLGTQNPEKFSLFKFIYKKIPSDIRDISMLDVKAVYTLSGNEGIKSIIEEKGGTVMSLLAPLIIGFIINPIYLSSSVATVGEALAIQLSLVVFAVIVGALLFLVVRIVMAIVARVVRQMSDDGKSMLSRLGGLLMGAVRGVMYCALLLVALEAIIGLEIKQLTVVQEQITSSVIAEDALEIIDKVTDNVRKTNKANDNIKKCISLLDYKNGSDEEISAWQKIIDDINSRGITA